MDRRITRVHAPLAATALFCLLVLSVAEGAAASESGGPAATASGVQKQLKKLKKKVGALQEQVDRLQTQPGPQGAPGEPGEDGSPDTPAQVLSKVRTVDGAGSGLDADLLDGQQGSAFVADGDSAGGDLSGTFSNLQLAGGTVGRNELASGGPHGSISFFEFSIAAGACHTRAFGFPHANLGEVLLTFPESADLGDGVYMRPTVVAHPGQGVLEICNSTGSSVDIPFGTFFQIRLIG
jgi:hypothetical protein